MIKANNISHQFSQGEKIISVLHHLNLDVADGETVAIVGKSGCGKSTLLNILSGLIVPTQGEINLLHQSFNNLSTDERTLFRGENIGVVFQQFHLLDHLSALENVQLPLELQNKSDLSIAKTLLERVGLSSRLNHYPSQLSGGEKQRVAIARAIVHRPSIILADEPSGSLDEGSATGVIDLLFELVKETKTSMVFVTHDSELAKKCDRVLQLDQGKLNEMD